MNEFLFFIELSSIVLLLLICFVITFGLKMLFIYLGIDVKRLFYTKKQAPVAPPKKENPPKKKRTPFKTIIIDPTKNTKIYFKPPNDD